MKIVKIIAGDLQKGKYTFPDYFGRPVMANTGYFRTGILAKKFKGTFIGPLFGEAVDFRSDVDKVVAIDEQQAKKFLSSFGKGLAGGIVFGAIGAAAGVLSGGNKREITFVCDLKDGKKFMAITDGETFTKIRAILF
jgi:hypothetical protein